LSVQGTGDYVTLSLEIEPATALRLAGAGIADITVRTEDEDD